VQNVTASIEKSACTDNDALVWRGCWSGLHLRECIADNGD